MRPNQLEPGTLLTAAELASVLKVNPHTISRWAQTGRIPVVKLGARTFRYDRDAVVAAFPGAE